MGPADDDRTRWLALYVLCVGMLMIVLDATIVNVALPSIQDDLGFSQADLAWVVNAYLIPFGGLLLLAGRLGARTEPRGPSGAADGGLASLYRREREVAALITERKTNKEVAAELFLSEKTVETHLRNIFAKLGASSRVEVARAVEAARATRDDA